MSRQNFHRVINFLLVLMATTPLLIGCKETTAVTPTAALPTGIAGSTGTLLPTIMSTDVLPTSIPTPTAVTPITQLAGQSAAVVFVKDGDIQAWDEATGQTETVFSSGDVIAVMMSDDGQVVAFLRRTQVKQSELDWYEQSALWAVDANGENARELVSAVDLGRRLNAEDRDSTDVAQIEWIPGTHRLLFSGMKYLVMAEGAAHAAPEGLYAVDVDALTVTELAPVGYRLRFVPSPDGQYIALMSHTGLSFMDADGDNWRQDVLIYPERGVPIPVFPQGVWAQDAHAFILAAPMENESPFVLNFTIWHAPLDGSPIESLATVTDDSHPASVTFSPDGERAAFYRWPEPAWLITPFASKAGPVATGAPIELGYANLHWSPGGVAYAFPDKFAGRLSRLCPDAERNTDLCGEPIDLGGQIAAIQWISDAAFLFMTRDPYSLSLGRLDGAITPIVTWSADEWPSLRSFSVALMSGDR